MSAWTSVRTKKTQHNFEKLIELKSKKSWLDPAIQKFSEPASFDKTLHGLLNTLNTDKNIMFDEQLKYVFYFHGRIALQRQNLPNFGALSMGGSMSEVSIPEFYHFMDD